MLLSDGSYLLMLPTVDLYSDGGCVFIIDATGRCVSFPDGDGKAIRLLQSFDGETPRAKLAESPLFPVVYQILEANEWLATLSRPLSQLEATFPALSRQISFFSHMYPAGVDKHFLRLADKRVVVVGCGGVGSHVSFNLCASGIGALVGVDPDCVDPTNLNRQFLYSSSDILSPKVEAMTKALRARFTLTEVTGVKRNFDEKNVAKRLLKRCDLVIVCGESQVLYDEPELCDNVALLLAGYEGRNAVVGPLIAPEQRTSCWRCLMRAHRRTQVRTLASAKVSRFPSWNPSGAAINAVVGAFAAEVAIRFLCGLPQSRADLGRQYRIDMRTMRMTRRYVEPRSCRHSSSGNATTRKV